MIEAPVEVIRREDRQRAIATLTLAFVADPIMRWAWSDADRYVAFWPGLRMRSRVERSMKARHTDSTAWGSLFGCLRECYPMRKR